MLIPIGSIAILNRQRRAIDKTKLAQLASDIEQNGLLHPIVVRRPRPEEETGGKDFVLCVGGRRTAAHILLGRTEIEANLKEALDPIRHRIVELSENVVREDLTWQEELDARAEIARLVKELNPGASHAEVAAEVGISEAQLSKDLTLHKAIRADGSLKNAASKGSALRLHSFKADIDQRIATVKATAGNRLGEIQKKLITADASQFIRTVPTASVDMVFTDLPYGIDYFEVAQDGGKGEYDDSAEQCKDLIADLVPQMLRVVKPTGWIVLFMCYEWHQWLQDLIKNTCRAHFDYLDDIGICPKLSDGPCQFVSPELPPWIWTRRGAGNHGHWPELHASNRYEMIVVVNGGQAKLTRKPVENVLDFPPFSGDRLHAMQKPHELCQELISRCTVPGELVFDACFGSGAHLAAAASLGRDFLGCDNNPKNLGPAISLVAQHWQGERKPLSLV